MPIKFNTSRVTDALIRALRYSSLFATDDTAQAIRDVSNDMTDTDLDALVATLDYGSTGGGGAAGLVTSLDDIHLMVDSDGLPAAAHVNFLRVTHGMDTAPITDPLKTVMSSYYNAGDPSGGQRAELVVGPDTKLLRDVGAHNTYYEGRIFLGSRKGPSGAATAYSSLKAGPTVLDGDHGFKIQSRYDMELRSNDTISFWYDDASIFNGGDGSLPSAPIVPPFRVGGFFNTPSDKSSGFHIGEYAPGVANTNALLLSGNGTTKDWEIILNTTSGGKTIRFVPRNASYDMNIEVNAAPTGSSPEVGRRRSTNFYPKFIVYGDQVHGTTGYAISAIRSVIADYHGNMLLLRNEDVDSSSSKSHFIRCQVQHPTLPENWIDQFTVLNNGDVCATGSITPGGGCDVAEWVVVPDGCDSGEVIIMDTDGVYKKSTAVADAKVVGVIADSPGINLGKNNETENQYPLAVCGIVDTFCTTENGPVSPGDLLVSSPDGKAQKADALPATGTVIGKALAALEQPGDGAVSGLVKMLAILQ